MKQHTATILYFRRELRQSRDGGGHQGMDERAAPIPEGHSFHDPGYKPVTQMARELEWQRVGIMPLEQATKGMKIS